MDSILEARGALLYFSSRMKYEKVEHILKHIIYHAAFNIGTKLGKELWTIRNTLSCYPPDFYKLTLIKSYYRS